MPSSYNIHQLKIYLQQTLMKEQQQLNSNYTQISPSKIQVYWKPLHSSPDFKGIMLNDDVIFE
jgi:hypothetical protein